MDSDGNMSVDGDADAPILLDDADSAEINPIYIEPEDYRKMRHEFTEIELLDEVFFRTKSVVLNQLSSFFHSQTPLFPEEFIAGRYNLPSDMDDYPLDPAQCEKKPKAWHAFESWLRCLDKDWFDQHNAITTVYEDLSSPLCHTYSLFTSNFDEVDSEDNEELKREWEYLEADLASAICEKGIVCLLGPRGSGKSYLLNRTIDFLKKSTKDSYNEGKTKKTGLQRLVRNPLKTPLVTLNLPAQQTQDPLDLLRYLLHDLNALLPTGPEEDDRYLMVEALNKRCANKLENMAETDEATYYRARLNMMKENYNLVLQQVRLTLMRASQLFHVVIVVEDFEHLTGERQTFLYNLIDLMSMKSEEENVYYGVTAVMTSTCLDSFSLLEKRVASRFPQRQIILRHPPKTSQLVALLIQHLLIMPPHFPMDVLWEIAMERRRTRSRRIATLKKDIPDEHTLVEPTMDSQLQLDDSDGEASIHSVGDDWDKYNDWGGIEDDPKADLDEYASLFLLKDPQSYGCHLQKACRKLAFEWNDSILRIFGTPTSELSSALNAVREISSSPKTMFNIIVMAMASLDPEKSKYLLTSSDVSKACRTYLKDQDSRVKLALGCSTLEVMLLIEMGRFEARIKAGLLKTGSPLVDINLPTAAKALDLSTAQSFLKSKSKAFEGRDGTSTRLRAVNTERLHYFDFERVYFEYHNFVASDPSLRPFTYPKDIVKRAFESLVATKLVRFGSKEKYHFSQAKTHTKTPVTMAYQPIKLMLTQSQIAAVIENYEDGLPDMFFDRLRL